MHVYVRGNAAVVHLLEGLSDRGLVRVSVLAQDEVAGLHEPEPYFVLNALGVQAYRRLELSTT